MNHDSLPLPYPEARLSSFPNLDPRESEASTVTDYARKTRILIVDDQMEIRALLRLCLTRAGFDCCDAPNGPSALQLVRSQHFDVVLSDIRMPGMSGIELLQELKAYAPDLAVIMLTANDTTTDAVRALKLGADDYILKPFMIDEVILSLNRALERLRLSREVRAYQTSLEEMVARRTSQLQGLFVNVMQSLIFALEAKDRYTDGHSRRVAWLTMKLGTSAGLAGRDLGTAEMGAMFHDLGKIGIREAILLKPDPLTREEYSQIQAHPDIGVRILQPMREFEEVLPIVRHHHENFDGSGYPSGLKGLHIPLGSRIIAVVDAFDALTTSRPYRTAVSPEEAVDRLHRGTGRRFDPQVVEQFVPIACDPEIQKVFLSPDWGSGMARQHPSPAAITPQLLLPSDEFRLD